MVGLRTRKREMWDKDEKDVQDTNEYEISTVRPA
jgi:hypothetical protein